MTDFEKNKLIDIILDEVGMIIEPTDWYCSEGDIWTIAFDTDGKRIDILDGDHTGHYKNTRDIVLLITDTDNIEDTVCQAVEGLGTPDMKLKAMAFDNEKYIAKDGEFFIMVNNSDNTVMTIREIEEELEASIQCLFEEIFFEEEFEIEAGYLRYPNNNNYYFNGL